MGKDLAFITPEIEEWIGNQKIFFVSTAPLMAQGHVNCSPKGLDSFRVIDPHTTVYQDLTGSGVETIAHVKENGRMTIMFCAFEGPPNIIRLYGNGEIIEPGHNDFLKYEQLFPKRMGVRSYIKLNVKRVKSSCGYSVPKYEFVTDRDVLDKWCEKKGEEGLLEYRQEKNLLSMDNLKGLG